MAAVLAEGLHRCTVASFENRGPGLKGERWASGQVTAWYSGTDCLFAFADISGREGDPRIGIQVETHHESFANG